MASNQKQKKPAKVRPAGLPTRQQVMDFIAEADTPAGKREIAKAFGLKGQEKIALKALLKDMADEGLIDIGPARAFHKMGGVPKVTVLRIVDVDDTTLIATPEKWDAEGQPAPRLRIVERGKRGALTIGDRILARTEEAGRGWIAHPMKKLAKASEELLGVVEEMADGKLWLRPVDKRIRKDTPISDAGEARPGDLGLAEPHGRPPRISARVTEILGDPFAPRSFSLIAIHKHGIPHVFPDRVDALVHGNGLTGQNSFLGLETPGLDQPQVCRNATARAGNAWSHRSTASWPCLPRMRSRKRVSSR